MGIKAVKRAKKQNEISIQNINNNVIPEFRGRFLIVDNDIKSIKKRQGKTDLYIQKNTREMRSLKSKFYDYTAFFLVAIMVLIAITGFNFGYIIMQLV
ncbi:MAG: hypothetical protein IAC55_02140 [Tyzzerella sp.]|uniref:Uncharacterized protein n=1 Tax=Candidatus Fimicola merdigallinarum TaxID=2840819 RepID=A0A9D9DUB5_9FIRM|nr:hypothetical protein [Candidatus Fimicola merdigallinarum]